LEAEEWVQHQTDFQVETAQTQSSQQLLQLVEVEETTLVMDLLVAREVELVLELTLEELELPIKVMPEVRLLVLHPLGMPVEAGVELDGIRFASLEWLRKLKQAAGRPKDLLDLDNLPTAPNEPTDR
jgi:hypothetical protein